MSRMAGSARVITGLWSSSHPGPTLVVTILAAALAASAGAGAGRTTLLTAAVFAGQLSVGISNDAIDAARDQAVGRSDKPIARGQVSTRAAWVAALVSLVLALGLSAPLGPGLLAAHTTFLLAAWAYNMALKAHALSILPFLLAFGIFPSFATLSSGQPELAAAWAWAAGASLGAAIHLTNVLPDLDDDAHTGVRGLPHWLGLRASAALAAAAVLVGAAATTAGPAGGELGQVPLVAWLVFGLVVVVVLVTVGLVRAGQSGRVLFRLVMLAALLLAAQLVVSGGSLAG